ncbi:hypothetical protein [Thermoactinomyces sp. DSM 45892]|uniref:hypothetical protein n=1 Tax=Thermoactinomyces sp. DSM 45892 TaxID=1882753 RepID=UPI0008993DAF|nr:hypothetical protein [Thermoactinomyces sp. DSM 45892]SDY66990.1 hypothetical protein SAMN05444416_10726 [Thermoactinomyces sp. DSM 45892]
MGSIAIIIAVFVGIFKLSDYILRVNNKKPVFTPAINRLEDLMDFMDDDEDRPKKKKKRSKSSSKSVKVQEAKTKQLEPAFPRASDQYRPNLGSLSQGTQRQRERVSVKPKPTFSPNEVQKAFVYREILGAPRALKPHRTRRYPR